MFSKHPGYYSLGDGHARLCPILPRKCPSWAYGDGREYCLRSLIIRNPVYWMNKALLLMFDGSGAYDVSDSFMWTGGAHMAEHQAGKDLTDELEDALQGEEVFEGVQ